MTRQKLSVRILALSMAVLMGATAAVPASAAPIGSGVTPTYDEAYYATLDYYGNLQEGSVVKSYALNGASSLTDYGDYDQVVNLTDSTPVSTASGVTQFQFGQTPEHFYFEGKTARPFQDLPWTITLRYTLNGVPARAEDLAGKQGVVEILLDIVPNPRASSYARYNYTLEAMAMFNQDDILSLEAQGAQVQLVGNLRTVLFMALPGEEQHFTIRVGTDDFSFGGMTFHMVPATLAQLEEIAKLSQRKDDLEEDYQALSGSLDALLDAMYNVQDGLYASAEGLDQLDIARGTISKGKGQLYSDAGVLRSDLTSIADLLEPVEQRAMVLSQTITSSKAVLGNMTDTAVSLQTQLDSLEKALKGLEDGSSDVRQVVRGLADMKSSLRSLQRALGDSYIGGSSSGDRNTPKLKESVEKTKQVGSAYGETNQIEFMGKMLELQGKDPEIVAGLKSLAGLTQDQAEAMGKLSEWQLAQGAKQQTDAMFAAKDQLGFQQFCDTLLKQQNPGMSDKDRAEQAKQMNDLWTIVKPAPAASGHAEEPALESAPESDPQDDGSSAPAEDVAPEAPGSEPAGSQEEAPAEMIPEESGDLDGESTGDSGSSGGSDSSAGSTGSSSSDSSAGSTGSGSSDSSSGSTGSGSSDSSSSPSGSGDTSSGSDTVPAGDGSPAGDTAPAPNTPAGGSGEDNTVGGAAVDLIVGGLDQAMSAANDRINAIQSELNSTINRITRPTGRVVGELADLCDDVDDLVDLIDSAEDLSAALRQSSEKLGSILNDVDALRRLLDEYEPTLQEGVANVGSLSTAAVATLRDLEVLLADSEALMKTSGNQLDAGTRQSLRGLAATLRQTARAMEATGDVKQAKLTINNIIEDTWHEYTGDINNILLMDAEAKAVSLTDSRNPAPSSVQILIRTQEIKVEEPTAEQLAAAAPAKTTFWQRVAQMFQDFWRAITGIFH